MNRDEVTVLLEKGVKVKDIAEQYCVTSGAVYAFMKSHHIQRPKVMKEKTKEPVICTEAIAKKITVVRLAEAVSVIIWRLRGTEDPASTRLVRSTERSKRKVGDKA